jgi:hypothetical protein
LFGTTHQEVVGFNVSVDDAFFMHNFDSLDHLDCHVEHRLQVKLPSALLE